MKMLIAGLAAVSALVAAAPAAEAQPYGHAYGHWKHEGRDEGWRDRDDWRGGGWRPHHRYYGPPVRAYYGPPRHWRHGYETRCFWRYGHRVCRSW